MSNSDTVRREISAAVERTLLEEARRNELTVAHVRAGTLLLTNAIDWFAYGFPELAVQRAAHSITIPLLSAGWLAVAVLIAVALHRRWYRASLRLWLPLLDGALVFLLFGNFLRAVGPAHFVRLGQLTAVGVTCALLAASGSLRLYRASAVLTTCQAVAIYAALSLATIAGSAQVALGVVVLLGVGLLSVRMTDVVRRAMASEVGRMTLARFLPEQVIADAHGDPLALITEPRSVEATILVSDLRGFTALAERLAPVDVLGMLNEVQGAFAAAVHEQGGVVDKFMGDGMLAVFGALGPDRGAVSAAAAARAAAPTDHAARALATAHAMRAALEQINHAWTARGHAAVHAGIGIHSGPVVTGCLGSGARLEFTVIGDTVNTASRLESLTKEQGRDVLVSDETARRAGPAAADLEALGEVPIRGRTEPLRIHALR